MLRVIVTLALISCALAVLNGKEGKIEDFPYLASLQHRGVLRCGAAIVNRRTLITATHCFKRVIVLEKLFVRYNTKQGEKGGKLVPVLKYLQHPEYLDVTKKHDIAIVWTKEHMDFSLVAKPIKMAAANAKLPVGEKGVITGWGRLGENDGFPDAFHYVYLPFIANAKCRQSGGGGYEDYRIPDSAFCAGYLGVGGKDACKSDSGSPFVYDNILYGIVSFGNGCGRKKFPGVYSNVAFYRDWIDESMKLEREGKLVIKNKEVYQ